MKDKHTQDQFIRLRVQGLSFARIAAELKVSKPTPESEAALDQVFGASPVGGTTADAASRNSCRNLTGKNDPKR